MVDIFEALALAYVAISFSLLLSRPSEDERHSVSLSLSHSLSIKLQYLLKAKHFSLHISLHHLYPGDLYLSVTWQLIRARV